MADPRALLDAYDGESVDIATARGLVAISRIRVAPKAFAALRAVLDVCDHSDEPCGIGSGEVLADDIRRAITTALEQP